MKNNRLSIGEVPSIPSTRVAQYNIWSKGGNKPEYLGAWGTTYGVNASSPLPVTLISPHNSGGLRASAVVDPFDPATRTMHLNRDGITCSIYSSGNQGLIGQTAIGLTDPTMEWSVTAGSLSVGDRDIFASMSHRDELLGYPTRYRLSTGLDTPNAHTTLLEVSDLYEMFGSAKIVLGDENGLVYPSYRESLDRITGMCAIGIHYPVYLYVDDTVLDHPSLTNAGCTAVDRCQIFLRSDTIAGSAVLTDVSPYSRSVSHNITHEAGSVFGDTSMYFGTTMSYIILDNADDGLSTTGDMTWRGVIRAQEMSTDEWYRLFTFGTDDYINISGTCQLAGKIGGTEFDGNAALSDWTKPTTLAVLRHGRRATISVDGKCTVSVESDLPFGGSNIYSDNIAVDGLADSSPMAAYRTPTTVFGSGSGTYPWWSDSSYLGEVYLSYSMDIGESICIKAYQIGINGSISITEDRLPTSWQLQGSNDFVDWHTIDYHQGADFSTINPLTIDCRNNQTNYRHHRILLLASRGSLTNQYAVGYIRFFDIADLDEADTMIFGSNDPLVQGFVGHMEEMQFNHSALKDPLNRVNDGDGYSHPGLEMLSRAESSQLDRVGRLAQPTFFNLVAVTQATATGSSELGGFEAAMVIDGDPLTFWDPNSTTSTIQISLARFGCSCNEYKIGIPIGSQSNAPTDWTLEGFDGLVWTLLDQRSNIVAWIDAEVKSFSFRRTSEPYQAYRLNITSVDGGSTINLAQFDLSDHSLLTSDIDYTPSSNYSLSGSGVRSGETHIASNDQWAVNGDESTLTKDGLFLAIDKPGADQIIIDNTGRVGQPDSLIKVDSMGWATPARLYIDGVEVFYRFIGANLITSETIDSALLMRVDLPSDTIVAIDVDLITAPTGFLSEDDIVINTSEWADDSLCTNLSADVANVSINGRNVDLANGLFMSAESDIGSVDYKSWNEIGRLPYVIGTYYYLNSRGGIRSAKNDKYALFYGWHAGSHFQQKGDAWIYSSNTNKFWRVADFPIDRESGSYCSYQAMTFSDGYFWSYGGYIVGAGFTGIQPLMHRYDMSVNTWTRKSDATVAVVRHDMSAIDSKIYSMCGYTTVSIDAISIYDVATDIWVANTTSAVLANKDMCTTDWSTDVFTLGGENATVAGKCDLNRFDTTTGIDLSVNTDCACGRRRLFGASRLENLWYINAGTDSDDTWICDMTTLTFMKTDDAELNTVADHAYEVFDIYALQVAGGDTYVRSFSRIRSEFARYDEQVDTSDIGYKAGYAVTGGLTINGHPYLFVSGGGDTNLPQSTTSLYDHIANQWIPVPDCPLPHMAGAGGIRTTDTATMGVVWSQSALYLYDVGTRAWTSPAVSNNTLQIADSNYGHCIANDRLYMYGGLAAGSPTGQLAILDLDTNDLSILPLTGDIPPSLYDANLSHISRNSGSENMLVLYGGTDGTGLIYDGDAELVTDQLKFTGNKEVTHGANIYLPYDRLVSDFTVDIELADLTTMTGTDDLVSLDILCPLKEHVYVGSKGMQWVFWNGSSLTVTARVNTYGAIRIVRVGSVLEYFYKDGPGIWTSLGTSSDFSLDDSYVVLRSVFDSVSKYALLDNLAIDEIVAEDFVGSGDPDSKWLINTDIFGDQHRSSNIYSIDTSTGVCVATSPSINPVGPTRSTSYVDRAISGTRGRILLRDIQNSFFDLDVTTMDWSQVDMGGLTPRIGVGHIFNYVEQAGVYTHPVFVIGYGLIQDGESSLLHVAHEPLVLDISLSSPQDPTYLNLALEQQACSGDKTRVDISGFNGSEWSNMGSIPPSVIDRSGKSYQLSDIGGGITAMKVEITCGTNTADSIPLICGIDLLTDMHFGRISNTDIAVFSDNLEIACQTPTDILPTTCFDGVSARPDVVQPYVIKEAHRSSSYRTGVAPVAYPYSAYFTTTDDSRLSNAGMTSVNSAVCLAKGNVKLAFSFDDRITWLVYNSGWSSIDIADEAVFRTSGILADELADIPTAAWVGVPGSNVDVAVLLTLESIDDYAYFSTLAFIGPDDYGVRLIYPQSNWLNVILDKSGDISYRSMTELVNSDPVKSVTPYSIDVGLHKDNIGAAGTPSSKSIIGSLCEQDPEFMWVSLDPDNQYTPYMKPNGSYLRTEESLDLFDYSTDTLISIQGWPGLLSTSSRLRRAYGGYGGIWMTSGHTFMDMGQVEYLDASTGVMNTPVYSGIDMMGGDGTTLGTETKAWLTPGSTNSGSYAWYNALVQVEYGPHQSYWNIRSSIPSSFTIGCAGLSDSANYGWMIGASDTANTYSVLKLDYSNDSASMTQSTSVDVSSLTTTTFRSTGASLLNNLYGYVRLQQTYPGSVGSHQLIRLDYATEVIVASFRTTTTEQGIISELTNTQSCSVSEQAVYWWTNQADKTGPLCMDLATETTSRRPSGDCSTGHTFGSQYCGAPTNGLVY